MKKKLLFAVLSFIALEKGNAQLLSQDFNSSKKVMDYVSKGDSTKFTSLSGTGEGTVVSIYKKKLRFDRTSNGDYGYFSKIAGFSPVPQVIRYQFDIEVSGNDKAQLKAAQFQVGTGFTMINNSITGTPLENNALLHSNLGIDFTSVPGQYSFRDIAKAFTSAKFTGKQSVSWVINNSKAPINYTAPDGSTETLNPDKWDLWVGNTKTLDDRNAFNPSQQLSDLKFAFLAGAGTIDIDNIMITDLSAK